MKFTSPAQPKKVTIISKDIKEIADHLVIPKGDDTMMNGNLLEISSSGHLISVDKDLWGSWTGRRFVNGEEYHGPIKVMNSDKPFSGSRVCSCPTCQPDMNPELKPN
jgi:hypothetical protein